eukprot:COSAG02_NODE_1391_length_12911_cov_246.579145_6_plen_150_part_00
MANLTGPLKSPSHNQFSLMHLRCSERSLGAAGRYGTVRVLESGADRWPRIDHAVQPVRATRPARRGCCHEEEVGRSGMMMVETRDTPPTRLQQQREQPDNATAHQHHRSTCATCGYNTSSAGVSSLLFTATPPATSTTQPAEGAAVYLT